MDIRAPVKPTLQTGSRVGNYVLKDKIGQGGFAEVWTAVHHERPGRAPVAVKIATDPEFRRQLSAEGRLPEIQHANVVPILDCDTRFAELPYIVMPFYEGGSLADEIAAHSDGLDEARIEAVLYDLLAGLAAAHALGIVHRDIKPQNILIRSDRAAIVADFGVSMHSGTAPMMQSVMQSASMSIEAGRTLAGTLAYMPPEVLEGKPATLAADVYAVGILLFEMLVGRRPAGLEMPSGARAVLKEPAYWDELFSTCCRPIAKRYVDAAAMRAALKRKFGRAMPVPASGNGDAAEQLREAVRIALADGVITAGEIEALEALAERLQVSRPDRKAILGGLRASGPALAPAAILRDALDLVLVDGLATASEIKALERMARRLGITDSEQDVILHAARSRLSDALSPADRLTRAIRDRLSGGLCTESELKLLELLAEQFGIRGEELEALLGDVRAAVALGCRETEPKYAAAIAEALNASASNGRILSGDRIPEAKRERARRRCGAPKTMQVIGLIDLTSLGSAQNCVMFGEDAMYYHNGSGSSMPGPNRIPYIEFPYRRFSRTTSTSRWPEISLSFGEILTVSGGIDAEVVLSILKHVRNSIKKLAAASS